MGRITTYGPWSPSSGASKRIRIRMDWDVGTPSAGASRVAVELRISVETGYGWWDSGVSYSYSTPFGSWSGPRAVRVDTGKSTQLDHLSGWLPTASTLSATASLGGVSYLGSSVRASHTSTITTPAAPAGQPGTAAPSVQLLSDSQARISWPQAQHATHYIIWQWDELNQREANIGSTSALYVVDGSLWPNNRYRWWVQASNSAGAAKPVATGFVRTTPARPDLRVWREAGKIVAEVSERARFSQGWELERSVDGGAWQAWTSYTGGNGTASMPVKPGQTVQVRARSYVTEGGRRVSTWTTSPTVLALAPPAAPTLVAPSGIVSTAQELWLWWSHVSRDASLQTAAEVRWRFTDATDWNTQTVQGTTGSILVQLAAGTYVWQARTKGQHAAFGDWSPMQGFRVAPPPTVEIIDPADGATVDRSRPVLTVKALEPTPGWRIVSWRAEAVPVDGQPGMIQWSGAGHPDTIQPPESLRDGRTYRLRIQVVSGSGLESTWAETSVQVDYAEPAAPNVAPVFLEEAGEVELTIDAVKGPIDPVSFRVEASYDNGRTWQPIATAPAPHAVITDTTPILGAEQPYRVFALSDLPSESAPTFVAVATPTTKVALLGDDGTLAWLDLDPSVSYRYGQEVVMAEYESDTSVAYPTPHYGTGRTLEADVKGTLTSRRGSPRDAWIRLLGQPMWWRSPWGDRWRATLTAGGIQFSPRRGRSGAIDVAGSVVRITE